MSPLPDKTSADKRPGAPGQENDVHAVDITRVMSAHRKGLSPFSCNHNATTFAFPPQSKSLKTMPAPQQPYRPYLERFRDPNGPGDQRPTAVEVINDLNAVGSLEGKVVLITGGTGGLGLETAKALRLTGAKIFITAHDEEKGKAAVDAISQDGKAVAHEFVVMDLASLESVRSAAADFSKRCSRLDVLITNAGQ